MARPALPPGERRRRETAYGRAYRIANPERIRAIAKAYRDRARLRALIAYSGDPPVCACCGEASLAFLCLDHTEGGGNADRRARKEKGGAYVYTRLSKEGYPPGYRVLCWNCNAAIGLYGACPHELVR